MSETSNQNAVRLAAAQMNVTLWRNNNGACEDKTGRLIRYGLANDSKELNEHIKSSDLIGVTPLIVQPYMVGRLVGILTAIEMKHAGWKFSQADKRAVAQLAFHDIVRQNGGFAGFATSPDDLPGILRW